NLTILPNSYEKGHYFQVTVPPGNACVWVKCNSVTMGTQVPFCLNEDTDFDGVLDPGEDRNNNGVLDPGNVATVPTSVTTDASGFAFFNVTYAKQYTWVQVTLTARTVVAGNTGLAKTVFFLQGAAGDFNNCSVLPPGQVSPFGTTNTCD